MAIYFPDGNGGRKIIAENKINLADIKLTGFSQVADATGELTDEDTLLSALAKLWNRRQVPEQLITVRLPSQSGTLTYRGSVKTPTWNNYDANQLTIGGTTSATNAGTYSATFTPLEGYAWEDGTTTTKSGVVWADGTSSTKNVSWTIEKASLAIPTITNTSIDYDGNGHAPVISSYNGNLITVTGNVPQTNAGSYTVVCSLKSNTNSQWSDGTTADVSTPWTIRKATVEVPTVSNTSFEQDGESHAPTISSYNTNAVTVTGNAAQTEAGTYTITFALKDKTNYQWLDGTTENISVEWEITYSTFYSSVGMLKSNTMRFGTDVFVLAES